MESTKEAWCKICAHAKKDCDVVVPRILHHLTNLFASRWLGDNFNVRKMTLIFSIPSAQPFLGLFWLFVNVGLTKCQLQPIETLLLYTYSNMFSCFFSCFSLKVINSGFRPCVKPNCKQNMSQFTHINPFNLQWNANPKPFQNGVENGGNKAGIKLLVTVSRKSRVILLLIALCSGSPVSLSQTTVVSLWFVIPTAEKQEF